MDKYNINFSSNVLEQDKKRLIDQTWKLIPMREHQEDWITQLYFVIEEIAGLAEIYKDNVKGLVLLSKLEGLTSEVCDDFMIYRKTVFKCIGLIAEVFSHEQL